MTRAIFFDIGDTLVFDEPPLAERFYEAAWAVGVDMDWEKLPSAFREVEKKSLAAYLTGVSPDDPDVMRGSVDFGLASVGAKPLNDGMWENLRDAFASAPIRRYAHHGAIPLLTKLRQRGFILGAVSDWEDTLPAVLEELGLRSFFDALAVSAAVGVSKPNPKLFQNALRQTGVPASETLHVGDWYELDVCGARAASMNALLFDHQHRRPDADCPRVTSFGQLSDWLLALAWPLTPQPPLPRCGRGWRERAG